MLEDDDGVVVPDRGLRQPLRIGGSRRCHEAQAGLGEEPAHRCLRVARAEAGAGADGGADDERDAGLPVRHVPVLRGLVDERVDDEPEEVAEHDLDDGAQPLDGGAEGGARERELGDRRVDDAVVAEAVDQSRGGVEDAARLDVLADQHDAAVALHLLGDAVPDRLAVADLAHQSSPPL